MLTYLFPIILLLSPAFSSDCDKPSTGKPGDCKSCDIYQYIGNSTDIDHFSPNELAELLDDDMCRHTFVGCSDESIVCDSIQLYAENSDGAHPIGAPDSTMAKATVPCGSDGRYYFGDIKQITSFYCVFLNCIH